jgi:hypothetical protein
LSDCTFWQIFFRVIGLNKFSKDHHGLDFWGGWRILPRLQSLSIEPIQTLLFCSLFFLSFELYVRLISPFWFILRFYWILKTKKLKYFGHEEISFLQALKISSSGDDWDSINHRAISFKINIKNISSNFW